MTNHDARFQDANDEPLRLRIVDSDDLVVVSALLQDAVFSPQDCAWDSKRREFSMLLNRFRWELGSNVQDKERVRAVFQVSDALRVVSGTLLGDDAPPAYSVLSVGFEAGEDGTGVMTITLSGDREIRIDVECLDASVTDVTRPYAAPSRRRPGHGTG